MQLLVPPAIVIPQRRRSFDQPLHNSRSPSVRSELSSLSRTLRFAFLNFPTFATFISTFRALSASSTSYYCCSPEPAQQNRYRQLSIRKLSLSCIKPLYLPRLNSHIVASSTSNSTTAYQSGVSPSPPYA